MFVYVSEADASFIINLRCPGDETFLAAFRADDINETYAYKDHVEPPSKYNELSKRHAKTFNNCY